MKLKQGFALRNIAGEHIVMPTGENIRKFDGAIVLNPVAAFIWETLSKGCSREELLQAILAEYEIDRAQAEQDLDSLLERCAATRSWRRTLSDPRASAFCAAGAALPPLGRNDAAFREKIWQRDEFDLRHAAFSMGRAL